MEAYYFGLAMAFLFALVIFVWDKWSRWDEAREVAQKVASLRKSKT